MPADYRQIGALLGLDPFDGQRDDGRAGVPCADDCAPVPIASRPTRRLRSWPRCPVCGYRDGAVINFANPDKAGTLLEMCGWCIESWRIERGTKDETTTEAPIERKMLDPAVRSHGETSPGPKQGILH